MTLPPLPAVDRLARRCREAAAIEKVPALQVEKDFYLTRLLWTLGQVLGPKALLKGGTLLSKVDLGFRRMSEDVDLVMPGAPGRKRDNAVRMKEVRAALRAVVDSVGLTLPFADGERFEQDAHVVWTLPYVSEFGPQQVVCEVSLRPVLRPPREVSLGQMLNEPVFGNYTPAKCWALDADEARAEKVRAAFTRTAIRDFYDLAELQREGADLGSASFLKLVNAKLAELQAPPIHDQPRPFGMTPRRLRELRASLIRELPGVLRLDAPPFDLGATLAQLDALLHRGPT